MLKERFHLKSRAFPIKIVLEKRSHLTKQLNYNLYRCKTVALFSFHSISVAIKAAIKLRLLHLQPIKQIAAWAFLFFLPTLRWKPIVNEWELVCVCVLTQSSWWDGWCAVHGNVCGCQDWVLGLGKPQKRTCKFTLIQARVGVGSKAWPYWPVAWIQWVREKPTPAPSSALTWISPRQQVEWSGGPAIISHLPVVFDAAC